MLHLLRKLLEGVGNLSDKDPNQLDLKRAQADAVSMNPVLLPSVKESKDPS